MVAVLKSRDFMPPVRWIRYLTPPPESLGQALRRLRVERGLDQEDVRKELNLGATSISNYETDKYAPPRHVLRQLNEYYGQAPQALSTILRAHQAWAEGQEPVPGPSVAIPQEPELIEAVEALLLLETEQLPHATQTIRLMVEGRPPGIGKDETPFG